MMTSENHISSRTARKILLEAEQNGVTVENYLKNIAENSSADISRHFIKKASVKYDFSKSNDWLKKNAARHLGKWIVLDGDRLVGSGENPQSLVEKARNEGVEIPFVQFVDSNSEPFTGGWL